MLPPSASFPALAGYAHDQAQRGLSDTTITGDGYCLRLWFAFLDRREVLPFDATDHHVREYLATRDTWGPRTRYWTVSRLASFYVWAIRSELTEKDPTVRVHRAKRPRLLPRPASDDAVAGALEAADDRTRIAILTACLAGLRRCELARLAWEDVSFFDKTLRVSGKGAKERSVPLHPALAVALADFRMFSNGPVFRHHDGTGKALKAQTLGATVNRVLADAGVTLHQLRHWFGTAFYRECEDLLLTAEAMGHADIETTRGYAQVVMARAAGVVSRLAVPDLAPSKVA